LAQRALVAASCEELYWIKKAMTNM